ncbi:MAG: glycosyltransferase family 2 protein [Kiritimatiellia bacterium]
MTIWFSFYLVSILLTVSAGLSFVDGRRKRLRAGRKHISVLVPCYNDARTIPGALTAIQEAMGNRHNYEILVADDGSTDNSREMLSELCDGVKIRLVVNPRNLGKSETLNRLARHAAHELILFMDADTLLHEKALEDMLARLEEQPGLGAVSCPYQPLNKGLLASLQAVDYSMIRMVQASYNLTSGLALWGGCIMIRREAFMQAEGFERSAITEDVDFAVIKCVHSASHPPQAGSGETAVDCAVFTGVFPHVYTGVDRGYRAVFVQTAEIISGSAWLVARARSKRVTSGIIGFFVGKMNRSDLPASGKIGG